MTMSEEVKLKKKKKKRTSLKKLNLQDIVRAPIEPGFWLFTYDPDQPQVEFGLLVHEVEGDDNLKPRVIRCKLLDNNHPRYKQGEDFIINLNPQDRPYYGRLVNPDDSNENFAVGAITEPQIYAHHIIGFLKMILPNSEGRTLAPMGEILLHLQKHEVIPKDQDLYHPLRDGANRKGRDYYTWAAQTKGYIRSLVSDILLLKGSHIELNPSPKQFARGAGSVIHNQTGVSRVLRVDRDKAVEGFLLIVESGLFGNVQWK